MVDYIESKACCVNRYTSVGGGGNCVRWIVMAIHVDPWWCIVRLGVEQRYGESPDTFCRRVNERREQFGSNRPVEAEVVG